MSLLFVVCFIFILVKLTQITVMYIWMDWTKEIDEKIKLIKVAYTLYFSTILATYCYLDSLQYVFKGG